MRALEHKIQPPLMTVLIGAAMWAMVQFLPAFQLSVSVRVAIGLSFAFFGLFIAGSGFFQFARFKTTIDPVNIDAAATLVTSGIYRYTRNPMYVGLTSLLLGWTAYLAVPWVVLGPIVFILFITRFQIIPEERLLSSKFGKEYDDYRQRVRRWL